MVPQLQEEDKRYALEVGRLNVELERERRERNQLQSQIDDFSNARYARNRRT